MKKKSNSLKISNLKFVGVHKMQYRHPQYITVYCPSLIVKVKVYECIFPISVKHVFSSMSKTEVLSGDIKKGSEIMSTSGVRSGSAVNIHAQLETLLFEFLKI